MKIRLLGTVTAVLFTVACAAANHATLRPQVSTSVDPPEYVVMDLPFDCSSEDMCYPDFRHGPDGRGIWVIVHAPNPN